MDAVKQVHVPSYENLSLKVVYAFFEKFPEVLNFLPDGKELLKVPKPWICNVGATVSTLTLTDLKVIGSPFLDWITQSIKQRNDTICKDKGMLIHMDEKIAQAFHASSAVSRK